MGGVVPSPALLDGLNHVEPQCQFSSNCPVWRLGLTGKTSQNAFCRLFDTSNGKEIARYDLSVQGSHTAQIMAKLYRHNGEWKMHAIGENASGRTFDDLMPLIVPHL